MKCVSYCYISTFCSVCVCVCVCSAQYGCVCSSLTSCFLVALLRCSLSDYETVPVAPLTTGITFAFTFHMRWICIIKSLYFKIFPASFLITFLSPGSATQMNMHVLCLLSLIMMSGLLLGIVLSFCTCWFHNVVTLTSWLLSTDFGIWSHQCLLANCTVYYYYYYYYIHSEKCRLTDEVTQVVKRHKYAYHTSTVSQWEPG